MANETDPQQLTLTRLLNTSFDTVYKKLIMGVELSREESIDILSIAVILVSQSNTELNRLGYRIVLLYGNLTGDFIPLYDISINTGLMPVAKLIKAISDFNESKLLHSEFIDEFTESYLDTFRENGITHTEQQLVLNNFFDEHSQSSIALVAPTSYGKSELIITSIKNNEYKKFYILVPSKSLLSQTKRRILDAQIGWIEKIVSHPEMHDEDLSNAVYILTQERLSRLLSVDASLTFDFLFVDEAHNLLSNDSRNELLASVINIIIFRNSRVAIKYLTPFLKNTSNLGLRHSDTIELEYLIKEYVKSERFYTADFRAGINETNFYDQYINQFIDSFSESNSAITYIQEKSADKNIIYFNKPKDIERFAMELSEVLEPIFDEDIAIAVEALSDNLHQDYKLVACLKKGVVYHHGSMTEMVRNYVEYLFRISPNLKYLISSSTLLEGVNLPIERLFVMNCKKGRSNLTGSQFKNLVGRVNRFSEIFPTINTSSLKKLEPEIHIVAADGYMGVKANIKNFLKQRVYVSKEIKDEPKNVLLENTIIDEKNKKNLEDAISRLENMENGIIPDYESEYVSTDVGHLLISNNVSEIDVFSKEESIQNTLAEIEANSIADTDTLMNVISEAFITHLGETGNDEIFRLKNKQAQLFYSMMLSWKIEKVAFKQMIMMFVGYWESLYERNPDMQVYVGKWGDEIKGDGFRELYTRIARRTHKEKINLAIVRIKEEEDYIEYILFRFIDVLNDLELLDDTFYKLLKYGTTDELIINFIKHGLSRGVAELVLENYSKFVQIDSGTITIDSGIINAMKDQDESILKIFEVEMNTGI